MTHLLRALRFLPCILLAAALCGGAEPSWAQESGAAAAPTATSGGGAPTGGRVLVVGFDGADWRKTEELMGAGMLPHMAALRDGGTAGPLISTNPAESAAGWAAINTGANPVKNGVPSFFRRNFTSGGPIPALGHISQGTVETEGMPKGGAVGFLDRFGGGNSHILLGVGVFFLATLIFRFLLRAHALLALLLGIALGAATALGTRTAGATLPAKIPGVVNNNVRLDGFWIDAARAGHESVALEAPLSLGRPGAEGARTLFGLGVPDVRASLNGDWFVYTTETFETGREPKGNEKSSSTGTGTIFRVDFETEEGADPTISSHLYGPVDLVALGAAQARYDEIESLLGDKEKRKTINFKESRELVNEKDDLKRTLSEMGAAPAGSTIPEKLHKHRTKVPMRIVEKKAGDDTVWDITVAETTQTIGEGEWSEFFSVRFEMGPLLAVNAVTRMRVASGTEPFELYVDTLQIDPREPLFWQPVSEPPGFAGELAKMINSPFETLGWGCMTNQMKDKLIDPVMFLQDVEFTMTYRRRLMKRMLEENDWRVLYSVFSTTDRVQHMMYRYYDPLHPQYDAEAAQQKVTFFGEEITLAEAIPAIYRQMDDIVGEVVAALAPDDTLILCADHGFTSYRRGMNVNNWLEQEGFLVLKEDLKSVDEGDYFQCVDWSKTTAYSLGLGMVFLNLEGREPKGLVKPEEAQGIMEAICAKFLLAKDGDNQVGSSATIVRDVYEGPETWGTEEFTCADVMLGFGEFYRVSWPSTSGATILETSDEGGETRIVAGPIYKDNRNPWSGDHASNDPNLVSGIFFCNRPVTSTGGAFSVMDIAPTVLDRLGVKVPSHYDRPALVFE